MLLGIYCQSDTILNERELSFLSICFLSQNVFFYTTESLAIYWLKEFRHDGFDWFKVIPHLE